MHRLPSNVLCAQETTSLEGEHRGYHAFTNHLPTSWDIQVRAKVGSILKKNAVHSECNSGNLSLGEDLRESLFFSVASINPKFLAIFSNKNQLRWMVQIKNVNKTHVSNTKCSKTSLISLLVTVFSVLPSKSSACLKHKTLWIRSTCKRDKLKVGTYPKTPFSG